MTRLYLATLDTLSPGAAVAQASHALTEFVVRDVEAVRAWHAGTNTVVCVSLNALSLAALAACVAVEGVPGAPFCEPDRGDELTAVAVLWPAPGRTMTDTPGTSRLLRRARLTGAPGRAPDAARSCTEF